jgi:hypothetical protein
MDPIIQPKPIVVTMDDLVICRKCKTSSFTPELMFALASTGIIGEPKKMITVAEKLICSHCREVLDRTQEPLTMREQAKRKGPVLVREVENEPEGSPLPGSVGNKPIMPEVDGKPGDILPYRGRVTVPETADPNP